MGIDKIIGWMPEKVNDWTGSCSPVGYSWKEGQDESGALIQGLQIRPYAKKIGETFRQIILTLVRMGHHLIIDDVSFGKHEVNAWREALQDFSVLWVGVNAPLSVLEQREKERGNRIVGSARGQFRKVHAGIVCNLEVDTHSSPCQEIIDAIKLAASQLSNQRGNMEKKF